MHKKPTKGRALMPDPNHSLFKFKLVWAFDQQGVQPKAQTWFSYDYGCERELFPAGLPKDTRFLWKELLSLCWKDQILYEFIKWLRPHPSEGILELYLPARPQITAQVAQLEADCGWQMLESHVRQLGFTDFAFKSVDKSHPRQAGSSPGCGDFRQFYGFKYLHRNNFIVNSLSQGKLLKVDVYDNLMYHTENYLHTLHGRMQCAPSVPA